MRQEQKLLGLGNGLRKTQEEIDLLDQAQLPFAVRHPAATYWIGIFIAFTGMWLEGLNVVKHAFVASGVLVTIVGVLYLLAAKRCEKIANHANTQVGITNTKKAENAQGIMNAQNLMHQAKAKGDFEMLAKLAATAENCENRESDFEEVLEELGQARHKFNNYESEFTDLSHIFVITGLLITSLGSYLF